MAKRKDIPTDMQSRLT